MRGYVGRRSKAAPCKVFLDLQAKRVAEAQSFRSAFDAIFRALDELSQRAQC